MRASESSERQDGSEAPQSEPTRPLVLNLKRDLEQMWRETSPQDLSNEDTT